MTRDQERKPFDDEPAGDTTEPDQVEPSEPGPGDSEGARPEPDPDEESDS